MALQGLREIAACIKGAGWYTVMADEVTDSANDEQFIVCIRYVDKDSLEVNEDFIGVYQVDNMPSKTLVAALKDALVRMALRRDDVRGQCYDEASNMMESKGGVATLIQKEAHKAAVTHCYGHSLQLTVCNTMKSVKHFSDVFDTVYEITKLLKYSSKRDAIVDKIKKEIAPGMPGFRALCPTRWTVRGDSFESIIDNYDVLRQTWEESLEEGKLDTGVKARIIGISSQMETFDFYFGVKVSKLILQMADNLSRTLQHEHLSASEDQSVARCTIKTLESMRSEESWELFWTSLSLETTKIGIPDAEPPRKRKRPARLESGAAEEFPSTPKNHYHRIWNEGFDFAVQGIKDRFEQARYKLVTQIESIFSKALAGKEVSEELIEVKKHNWNDFKESLLQVQLHFLYQQMEGKKETWREVYQMAKEMSSAQRGIISEVIQLIKLILLIPATSASSERAASAVRRIKTYLRSTMSQQKLNHCMILHIHKELTDSLSLLGCANQFIYNENRRKNFGKFSAKDLIVHNNKKFNRGTQTNDVLPVFKGQ